MKPSTFRKSHYHKNKHMDRNGAYTFVCSGYKPWARGRSAAILGRRSLTTNAPIQRRHYCRLNLHSFIFITAVNEPYRSRSADAQFDTSGRNDNPVIEIYGVFEA